ncbi:MAG: hypothetical protein WCB19_05795 [Thermoplasmata archaeon]
MPDEEFNNLERPDIELNDDEIWRISVRAFECRRSIGQEMGMILRASDARVYPRLADPSIPIRSVSGPITDGALHLRVKVRLMDLGLNWEDVTQNEIREMIRTGELP